MLSNVEKKTWKNAAQEGEELQICRIHGKPRSAESLQPGPDGSMECRVGCECRVGVLDGDVRPPCKFFAQGACKEGEECPFIHEADACNILGSLVSAHGIDISELRCSIHGKKRSAGNLRVVDGSLVCRSDTGPCKDTGEAGPAEPCAFFAQGHCKKGAACRYLHSGSGGCKGKKGKGYEKGDSWKGSWKGDSWKGSDSWTDDSWKGSWSPKGGKGYSKGYGTSSGERRMCEVHGKMRGVESLTKAWNGTDMCKPGEECKQGADVLQICTFFQQGTCLKGDGCPFVHPGQSPSQSGKGASGKADKGSWGKSKGSWGKGKDKDGFVEEVATMLASMWYSKGKGYSSPY